MRQNIFTLVLLIFIAGGGAAWYWFSRQSGEETIPVGLTSDSGDIQKYRQLLKLKLDPAVFSNPLFQSFQQFGSAAATATIPKGRANPFAPF